MPSLALAKPAIDLGLVTQDAQVMLAFYRDTFASRAASDQPLYDMKKVNAALDKLLESPEDQRIAVEGGFQRIASVIVMQEKFGMT